MREELDFPEATKPLELTEYQGRPALLLEDPGGIFLSDLVGRNLPVPEFIKLALGIAAALGAWHRRGQIHRDVKPTNILIDPETADVRLTGWEVASRTSSQRALADGITGSLAYMAPEQTGRMGRPVDARSDLYSLGSTLYELLAGTTPFTANDPVEWVHCHLARQPSPPHVWKSGIPEPLSEIVMKLLAKTPEDRFQTAAGLIADLRHCQRAWEDGGRIESFDLGSADWPEHLQIPRKVYGRENELGRLVSALERVAERGDAELVLLSGQSGVGKSSLVQELQKAVGPGRCFFACGKFDQYKRGIPYATLAQAFQELVRQLLAKSESEVDQWRLSLSEALGSNGALIANLIPEIELVIGPQAPVPELPPQEMKSRFHRVLGRFIGVFAKAGRPLVFFLDDLQWLDPATLELLEHLVVEPKMRSVLLIGAYRGNEIGANHPLAASLEKFRSSRALTDEIELSPLGVDAVGALVSDAMRCAAGRAVELTRVVHEKTAGNPFFVSQFLTALADEGAIAIAPETLTWEWDLAKVRSKTVTDNMASLVVERLNRLPGNTLGAVRQLACLGGRVPVEQLCLALGGSEGETHAVMGNILQAGLVVCSNEEYAFLHDRVREAAYALLSERERQSEHLRIGKLLASHLSATRRDDHVFEIATHFENGLPLIQAKADREQAAEIFLNASRRAKTANAVASALKYASMGCTLVSEQDPDGSSLAFPLALTRAECEYLSGHLAEAEGQLAELARRVESRSALAAVTCLQVELYTNMDQAPRAIEVGFSYLARQGICWSIDPLDAEIHGEFQRIREQLGKRPIEDLTNLPPMKDEEARALLEVLTFLHAPANFLSPNLLALIIGRMANLSLEFGNGDGSPLAFVYLGMLFGSRLGDFRSGFRFGKAGLQLVEGGGLVRYRTRVLCNFGNSINPWTRHVRTSIDLLKEGVAAAKETGDSTFAAYNLTNLLSALLAAGRPLEEVQREAETGLADAQKARFGTGVDLILAQLGLIHAWRGKTARLSSFRESEEEDYKFERHLSGDTGSAMAACWHWVRKMQAFYHEGNWEGALAAAAQAAELTWTSPAFFILADYHFYAALTLAAACRNSPREARAALRAELAVHDRKLTDWKETCVENFEDRTHLIAAEIARIDGRTDEAMLRYEEAIRSARIHGFIQNEALALELAAGFYAERGIDTVASSCLRAARDGYSRWGADGIVRHLEQLHPWLGENSGVLVDPFGRELDLLSLAKSTEAISEEIVLDRLIGMLMKIALECAGAQRGLLILAEEDNPHKAAEAAVREGRIEVVPCEGTVSPADLPLTVLHYALRTRESVILDEAGGGHFFADDAYWRGKQPQSVMCLPIVKQTKIMGALYLENDLAPGLFTSGRASVLKLLASRAAISLENARLYADLERENAERRRVEEELRRSEGLMAEGQRIGHTGSWAWNVRTGRLTWTDERKRMFGFATDRQDFTLDDFAATIHPEDRARALGELEEAVRSGASFDQEFRILLPDGTLKYIHGAGQPVLDEEGMPTEYFGAAADITEQKKVQLALKQALAEVMASQEQLRSLIDTTPAHGWMASPEGNVVTRRDNRGGSGV